MNDDGRRKLISHAATLEFAAVRRQHILDPSAIRTVGERNQESVGLSKHIHRGAVEFAGLTTYACHDSEARQATDESDGDPVGDGSVECG